MGWWKASPPPEETEPTPIPTPSQPHPPAPHPLPPNSTADACPVDHKTREIWLQQARAQSQAKARAQPDNKQPTSTPQPQPPRTQLPPPTTQAPQECSSDRITQTPDVLPSHISPPTSRPLSHSRVISSIPRASPSTPLANNESETGHDKPSGNWIYPSESQFFHAVMRKSSTTTSPELLAQSISTIIPMHNAVNERAWSLIQSWEPPPTKECPSGSKLYSFHGLGAGALSPRAKWKSWVMGYTEPFDRHDWVVERCGGERVEYVIDFYKGKEDVQSRSSGGNVSFYLDVRPKLNSVEGCRMRVGRYFGWL